MKGKKSIGMMLAFVVLLTGCGNTTGGQGGGGETSSIPKVSQEEAVTLVKEAVEKTQEIDRLFWQNTMKVDENQVLETPYNNEGFNYVLVTDPNYKSIQDVENKIRTIYTKAAVDNYFGYGLYPFENSVFLEKDGKLYRDHWEGDAASGIVWNPDSATISYQGGNRLVVFVNYIDPNDANEEPREGKMAFEYEEGQWKLESYIPADGGSPFYYFEGAEEGALSREAAIEYAGKKTNGYRLKKDIKQYFLEFKSDTTALYDPENDDWYEYYELDVLSEKGEELQLEDKIFVPAYGDAPLVLPQKDDKGLINLDYSALVENPGADSLYAFVPFGTIDEEYVYEAPTEYQMNMLLSDRFVRWDMGGDQLIFVVPKYYQTTLRLMPLETSGGANDQGAFYNSDLGLFVKCGKGNRYDGKITVQYKGEQAEFTGAQENNEVDKAPDRGDFVLAGEG